MHENVVKRKADWQRLLSPVQNRVTHQQGPELAHASGRHRDFSASGIFHCVCCGKTLVSSHAKIVAKSEWPAFLAPVAKERVRTAKDIVHFTVLKDVLCSNCNAHLGYVLNDGRLPAGVHYFINAVVVTFDERGGCTAETVLPSSERAASLGERGPV